MTTTVHRVHWLIRAIVLSVIVLGASYAIWRMRTSPNAKQPIVTEPWG